MGSREEEEKRRRNVDWEEDSYGKNNFKLDDYINYRDENGSDKDGGGNEEGKDNDNVKVEGGIFAKI